MNQPILYIFKLLTRMILLSTLIMFVGNNLAAAQDAEKINIAGTGSFMGSLLLLADEFNKTQTDLNVVTHPNLGSGAGIRALIGGELDIAILSRPLRESESEQNIIANEFARTPFVVVVQDVNNTDEITIKELEDIYSGKTTRWPDGERIRFILRRVDDDHTYILKGISPEMENALLTAENTKGAVFAFSDEESADALESIPGSIGISVLASIKSERRTLKALKLNGVAPTIENIANGTYQYYEQFLIVTSNNPETKVKRFIDYFNSDAAKRLLEENGSLVEWGN